MPRRTCPFALALLPFAPIAAPAVTIPVLADASVYSTAPDTNYGTSTSDGGLFTGEASGTARFYLKFQLPAWAPGTQVTAATLIGTYSAELFDATDGVHGIYLVTDDAWLETGLGGLTWNNQPGSVGGALDVWDAAAAPAPPVSQSFDLTAAANAEYQGDGMLSLLFRAVDEGEVNTWEYWSSKEHSALPGFVLDVTLAPVPEPGTASLLGLGLAALAGATRRRHRCHAHPR